MSKPREDKGQTEARWQFKFLGPCVSVLGLVIIDVALRVLGLIPPEDPLLTLDPDLVIVNTGHNEMLKGNMDDASRFGFSSQLRVPLLSISSIFAWANYAVSYLDESRAYDLVKEEVAALEAGRILVYDPLKVPLDQCRLPSDEFLNSVASSYGANVQTTILKALQKNLWPDVRAVSGNKSMPYLLNITNSFHKDRCGGR